MVNKAFILKLKKVVLSTAPSENGFILYKRILVVSCSPFFRSYPYIN